MTKMKFMRSKLVFWILPFAFFISACNLRPDHFEINGKITDAKGGRLVLEKLGNNNKRLGVDSIILDETGNFKLAAKATDPGFYSLNLDHKRSIILAIHPDEKLEIQASSKDMGKNYTIKGSRDSELTRDLIFRTNLMLSRIEALGKIYYDSIHSSHISEIKSKLDSSYLILIKDHRLATFDFIKSNPASFASLMALYQVIPSANPMQSKLIVDPMENLNLYILIDSTLMSRFPSSEPVILLHQQVIGYLEQKKEYDAITKNISIGSKAPEIVLPSYREDTIRLSALKGKYVLLTFWASWSDESRILNTKLKPIYQKYRWNGFEILQVSLDKSKDAWQNAIAQEKLPWKNASDLLFWNSSIAARYNVHEIPYSFLIGKDGRIIQKEISPEKLNEYLKGVFKF
jgi:peroxiredoxin